MNMYECRVRYEKTLEDGNTTKVTEIYIVDAISISEAESRFIEEMTPYISGEFEVIAIKKVVFSELVLNDKGENWFKVKVYFITLDERSGKEKKTPQLYLVQATTADDALNEVNEFMKSSVSDWEVGAVTDTSIIDVFTKK